MDPISGALGAATGIFGMIQQHQQFEFDKEVQLENWRREKEQQDYDRKLQQTMFQREDSAYQRKAQDMQRAGFNRLLAVGGSGSGSGPVVKSQAPQLDRVQVPNISDNMGKALNIIRMKDDITKSAEEINVIKAQKDKISAEKSEILERVRAEKTKNDWVENNGGIPIEAYGPATKEAGVIAGALNKMFNKASNGADGPPPLLGESKESYDRRYKEWLLKQNKK